MSSIVWLPQATQILGSPTRTYEIFEHCGNPRGGPAGSSAENAMSSQQRERELLLLGRLPDPLGRGEMLDHLVHVGDLDRAALGDVVAGPGLAGGQRVEQEHPLAML